MYVVAINIQDSEALTNHKSHHKDLLVVDENELIRNNNEDSLS